ncbi:MAG: 16S rRNA (uracil(1498)-N(3))-methyltransferase [Candidatus Eisenbacteria bacterium]|nr:16S rRNA (uracil(1498)-N(3))-methyltransferase [Candidatus Eisenbacteria bacterium]
MTIRDRDERSRFFYVLPSDLRRSSFRFPPDEEEHILRVLRLRTGAVVTAVDGEGWGAHARLRMEGARLEADVIERFRSRAEPLLRITLAAGLLKGQEMDRVVERCAEIGVAVFQPFVSERSVPGGPRVREGKRLERWERLARSGMKVARGAALMSVQPVSGLDAVIDAVRLHERSFVMEREAPPLPREVRIGTALVVVGPEGGLTAEERKSLLVAGAEPASLGPRNLRAGTASLAAAAFLLAPPDPWEVGGPEVVEKVSPAP